MGILALTIMGAFLVQITVVALLHFMASDNTDLR
jgi:hypothetical protein